MTEEQYQKVISLDKRLNELKEVYSLLDNKDTHLSYYQTTNSGTRYRVFNCVEMAPLKDILLKHEELIRQEIKAEIAGIKKQISEI